MKVSSKLFPSQVWENKDAKTGGDLAGGGKEALALQSRFAAAAPAELMLPCSFQWRTVYSGNGPWSGFSTMLHKASRVN